MRRTTLTLLACMMSGAALAQTQGPDPGQNKNADVPTTIEKIAGSEHDRVVNKMVRPAPGRPKEPVAILAPKEGQPATDHPEDDHSGFLFFPPLASNIYGYGDTGAAGSDVWRHDPSLRKDAGPSDLREGQPEQPGIGHRAYENVTGVNGAPKYILDQGRSFDERCGLVYHRFFDYAGNSIDRPVPVCN